MTQSNDEDVDTIEKLSAESLAAPAPKKPIASEDAPLVDSSKDDGKEVVIDDDINFGTWLKNQRVSKKISLEEIAAVTKVHIQQLKALEEDRKEHFPAAAFVRGFLVSYARHLSLNEDEVLLRYKKQFGSLTPITDQLMGNSYNRVAKSTSYPKVRMVSSPHLKRSPQSQSVDEKPSWIASLNPKKIVMILGICLFVGVIILLISIGKKVRKEQVANATAAKSLAIPIESPKISTEPKVELPGNLVANSPVPAAPVPHEKPAPTHATPPPEPVAENNGLKKFQLELRAVEQNWVNIRIDDGDSKGMLLKVGSVNPFGANRRVTLALSDAGSVEIRWNGTWYAAPGSRGDVKTLTLPDQLPTLTVKAAPKVVKAKVVAPKPGPAPAAPTANDSAPPSAETPPAGNLDE